MCVSQKRNTHKESKRRKLRAKGRIITEWEENNNNNEKHLTDGRCWARERGAGARQIPIEQHEVRRPCFCARPATMIDQDQNYTKKGYKGLPD